MTERPRATRGPQIRDESEEHGFSLDELKEWKTQIEKTVHEHPILSASIAVGVGVLIARLIRDAMDDESDRKRRRKRKGGLFGSEIGKAVMGSLATMAAAKLQETLLSEFQQPDEEEEAEEAPPPRRRPRKQASRPATQRRTPPRRRKPPVEE
jgi:hypothetical protein